MNILITGGCGFVGSSLALYFKSVYPDYHIITMDNLKRRGSELNPSRLKYHGIEFHHGDIRFSSDFFQFDKIDLIIDAAAEPSVQAGLTDSPDYLIETNFMGTYNTLEFARRVQAGIIFLSTSRVYSIPSLEGIPYYETTSRFEIDASKKAIGLSEKGINEDFDLNRFRSLYGTTKLASEMLVHEYNALFGLQTVINRCGVLTGPWQMGKVDQGFIVLWMAKHFWKGELSYWGYGGNGKQVRDILHIHDLFRLLDWQMHNFNSVNGNVFNVGGGLTSSVSLLELTTLCSIITGNTIPIQQITLNRKADIPIYISDNSKVNQFTGWSPQYTIENTLKEVFEWLSDNEHDLKSILS
jgi:CDP-paratose 2-epimerase